MWLDMAKDNSVSDQVAMYGLDENVNHYQKFQKKCISNGNNPTNVDTYAPKDIGFDLVSNVPDVCMRKNVPAKTPDHLFADSGNNTFQASDISTTSDKFFRKMTSQTYSAAKQSEKPSGSASSSKMISQNELWQDFIKFSGKDKYFQQSLENSEYSKALQKLRDIKENKPGSSCGSEQNLSEAGPDIAQYIQGELKSLNSCQALVLPKSSSVSGRCDKQKYSDTSLGNVERKKPYQGTSGMASDVANELTTSNVLINFSSSPKKFDNKVYTEDDVTNAAKMQELHFHEKHVKKDKEYNEQMRNLEKEKQVLKNQLAMYQKTSQASIGTLEELLKLFQQWIVSKERERVDMASDSQKLMKERDQALEDLKSVESAFADLHRRYENCKSVLETYKQNEDRLKQQSVEVQSKLKQQEQMYAMLRIRTQDKLDSANTEIENAKKSGDAELAVLRVQLKKAEMRISGLEKDIEQKNKENSELSSICDDLIAKVGKS